MKSLEDHLSGYAAYHRDGRNIATHFVGIPMIVLAILVLLSRPVFELGGLGLSPAPAATLAAAAYYLRLDLRLGATMTALLALGVGFGAWAAAQTTGVWLAIGLGGFVVGWVIQFAGHAWEGRKPAFLDDMSSLMIGPLFVVAELGFLMGLRPEVRTIVEARSGPVRYARL
jgi:uncharacterized membrane protein YGL010W